FEYLLDINVIAKNIEKERVGELFKEVERLDSSVNFLKDPYFDGIFSENREAIGLRDEMLKQWKDVLDAVTTLNNVKSAEAMLLVHNSADTATFFMTESSERLKDYAVEQREIAVIKKRDTVFAAILLSFFAAIGVGGFFIVTVLMPIKKFFAALNRAFLSGFKENLPENLSGELRPAAAGINNAIRGLASAAEENRRRADDAAIEAANYAGYLDAISRMTLTVGATLSPYDVFKAVIASVTETVGADCVAVFFKEGNVFRLKFSNGYSKTFFYKGEELPVNERSFEACAKGEPMVFRGVKEYPEGRFRDVLESEGVQTLVMVPVMREGEAVGFLDVAFKNSKGFTEADLFFLKTVTGNMGVAVLYSEIFFKEFNAKAFFERIIHQMPFGAAVFDKSGVCVLANGAFKKQMGGSSSSDFVGNYRIFDDETLERQDLMRFVRKCYEGQSAEFTAEYKGRGAAVTHKLKIRSFPVFEAGGDIGGIALLYEDAVNGKERQST
ncbi:MAG: GAF domain-containing protein, partial [Thermodesulfobacteriota bacterium]